MMERILEFMGFQSLLQILGGTFCTIKYGISRLYCSVFCEFQLSLVNSSCEHCGSVSSYFSKLVNLLR